MKKRQNAFMRYHPVVQFVYFAVVILTTMMIDHPIILLLSFLGAFLYSTQLYGFVKCIKTQLLLAVPLFCAVILINALFNHYGVTVLCYIRTGAVTLESVVYGVVLAFMLWTAIIWFGVINKVFTTDRMIYLFGRVTPMLSLVLSMVLRFVPRFAKQSEVIRESRRAIGADGIEKSFAWKVKNALQEFSMLTTWSLEHGADTAASMRARGYGLKKRSFYAVFLPTRRDYAAIILLFICYVVCLIGFLKGYAYASYNPQLIISGLVLEWHCVVGYLAWGLICLLPAFCTLWERKRFSA